jgi:hypothetical protein
LSKPPIITEFIGSTLRATFVCSGATISGASSSLRNGSHSLVTSLAATSSGNGHMFADLPLPTSAQWMVNEWIAVINANTYRRFALVDIQGVEVD